MRRTVFILVAVIFVAIFLYSTTNNIFAEGSLARPGFSGDNDASSDAVSWSNASPIMIDSYGKYIVPIQRYTGGAYHFAYSNDKGSTWATSDVSSTVLFRPTAVYDSRNDKIHVLREDGSFGVRYERLNIKRDKYYNITGFYEDPNMSGISLDSQGSCSASDFGTYPVLLWKDDGANGILVAFWSVTKTCSSVTKTENRASMITLSNTSADATASNWDALNGTTDTFGPASVDFNALYSYTGSSTNGRRFIQSVSVKGGSTGKANDIYFFNIDENETYGFRRLAWNSGSSNWSGAWTSRVTFAGDVNGTGYGNNDELITKPVTDPDNDRVYVGIGWYRNATLKDTQTLYYVNASDSVVEAGDVYNHKGGTWFAPTLDIMYNDDDNKVYVFYQTSSTDPTNASNTDTTYEGDGWYKTYDGSTFSSAQSFLTQDIGGVHYTVDIPIVYKSPVNGKILAFFRADGTETPYVQPHYFLTGSISSTGTDLTGTVSVTSPYTATTYSDFDKSCIDYSSTQLANTSGGEIELKSLLRDDFETPRSPYTSFFFDNWTSGVWTSGSFYPAPSGTALIYGSGGAYLKGVGTATNKVLEFRAKFTQHNFQHVGWVEDENFGTYVMFSTGADAQLRTRTSNGTETASTHGTSNLGSMHKYKIEWGASSVIYSVDDSVIQTTSTNVPSGAMRPFLSNNTTTSGSDLTLDWIKSYSYSTTTGTYRSCSLAAADTNTVWGALTYSATTPTSTSVQVKTRTSNDNSSWTAWSSALSSGDTITSDPGKYLQYQATLTGTSTESPSLNNISIAFTAPTPTPTPTPTTNSSSTSSSNSSSNSSVSPPVCSNTKPEKTPSLYAATAEGTSAIKLYFADDSTNVDRYVIEYGTSAGSYIYSANNIGGKGARTYLIESLSPNTTYYFHMRNGNGCTTGNWSQEISAKTAGTNSNNIAITNITQSTPSLSSTPTSRPSSSPLPVGSPLSTTSPSATVSGYSVKINVKDDQQNPVKNAKVTLHSTPKTAYTNSQGIAEFSNVEQGEHRVEIAYDNYYGEQQLSLTGDVKEFSINVQVKKVEDNPFTSKNFLLGLTAGGIVIGMVLIILIKLRKGSKF